MPACTKMNIVSPFSPCLQRSFQLQVLISNMTPHHSWVLTLHEETVLEKCHWSLTDMGMLDPSGHMDQLHEELQQPESLTLDRLPYLHVLRNTVQELPEII